MDALHVRAEQFNGINGVRLAVKNEIRQIEVDALIVRAHIENGTYQSDGSFLPSFVAKILPIALAVFRHLTHGRHGFAVNRVVRIFRNESTMCLDGGDTALLCKIGRLLNVCNSRRARRSWN